jgi:hypothetical protein
MARVKLTTCVLLVSGALGCQGSVAPADSGPVTESCMVDSLHTCFEGTGLSSTGIVVFCDISDAAVTMAACAPGHVGCCVQTISGGTVTTCEYPPQTVDAAATVCAQIDGGVFTPN